MDCHCLAVKWWVWKRIPPDSSSGYILVLQSITCYHIGFGSGFLSKQQTNELGNADTALHHRALLSAGAELSLSLRCVCASQAPKCFVYPHPQEEVFFLQLFPIRSQLLPCKNKQEWHFFSALKIVELGRRGEPQASPCSKMCLGTGGSEGASLRGKGSRSSWLSLQGALVSLPRLDLCGAAFPEGE